MEDIYGGVGKPTQTLKQEIENLKLDGLSVRAIGEKLGISKDKVFRTLKDVSQSVADSVSTVANKPESVAKVSQDSNQAPQGIPLTNIEIKKILEDFEERILGKVQSVIEGRIEGIVRSYCEKTLIPLVKSEISKVLLQSGESIQGGLAQ